MPDSHEERVNVESRRDSAAAGFILSPLLVLNGVEGVSTADGRPGRCVLLPRQPRRETSADGGGDGARTDLCLGGGAVGCGNASSSMSADAAQSIHTR